MKSILFLFFLFSAAAQASCNKAFVRATKTAATSAAARIGNSGDKFLHCSVSCVLRFQCTTAQVYTIGFGKEVWDVFTPGDADAEDMRANVKGITLVTTGRARNRTDCYHQCDSYYP